MDMSWQAMLREAANASFEKEIETLADAEHDTRSPVDLPQAKIQKLSEKILGLPHKGIVLLFSRYCFRISPEETETFFQMENAKGRFRFYRELLSAGMSLRQGQVISDDSLSQACEIAQEAYMRTELKEDPTVDSTGKSRTRIVLQRIGKAVAVAAITCMLLFSTAMAVNAQFRESVITWVIETFDKYSGFEVQSDGQDGPKDPTAYQAGYLPDGAILVDTEKQPEEEPDLVVYEYSISESESFEIMISQAGSTVFFDTENTKIEPFEKDGVTGYFFGKNDLNYICFERDGCFFAVCGSVDRDELIKVAAGITKK